MTIPVVAIDDGSMPSGSGLITNAATQVASYYGISPSTVALFDMLSPLFTTPIRNASGMDGPITNEAMAEGLREKYGVAQVIIRRKPYFSKPAPAELIDELANAVDVAAAAVGG